MVERARIVSQWGESTGEVDVVRSDPVSGAMITIDFPHHKIHKGLSYTLFRSVTHGAGASPNILMDVGSSDRSPHFTFDVVSDDVVTVTLYESPDYSGGSALSAHNRNRYSSNTPIITATTDASDDGSGKGTPIWSFKAGANKAVAGTENYNTEHVLKTGTKYLLEAVGANGDIITMLADWYEHEPYHL